MPFVTEKSDRSGASNNISDFVDVEKIAGNLKRPSGATMVHGSMSDTDLIMAMPRTSNAT